MRVHNVKLLPRGSQGVSFEVSEKTLTKRAGAPAGGQELDDLPLACSLSSYCPALKAHLQPETGKLTTPTNSAEVNTATNSLLERVSTQMVTVQTYSSNEDRSPYRVRTPARQHPSAAVVITTVMVLPRSSHRLGLDPPREYLPAAAATPGQGCAQRGPLWPPRCCCSGQRPLHLRTRSTGAPHDGRPTLVQPSRSASGPRRKLRLEPASLSQRFSSLTSLPTRVQVIYAHRT